MKTKRTIVRGVIIWMIAILMPLVWFGTKYYYKKDNKTHGYWVGQTMLLTAAALDALITVPVFIIPMGGSYYSFFTALEFWIIAFEFLTVATLYWYIRVYPKHKSLKA